jgi:hypothetical protein
MLSRRHGYNHREVEMAIFSIFVQNHLTLGRCQTHSRVEVSRQLDNTLVPKTSYRDDLATQNQRQETRVAHLVNIEIIGVDVTETHTPPFKYQLLQAIHFFSSYDSHRKTVSVARKKTRDRIAGHGETQLTQKVISACFEIDDVIIGLLGTNRSASRLRLTLFRWRRGSEFKKRSKLI